MFQAVRVLYGRLLYLYCTGNCGKLAYLNTYSDGIAIDLDPVAYSSNQTLMLSTGTNQSNENDRSQKSQSVTEGFSCKLFQVICFTEMMQSFLVKITMRCDAMQALIVIFAKKDCIASLFSPKKIASHRFNCICTAILAMPDNLGLNFLCFSRMDPNWYIFTEHYLNMYILLTIIVLKCIYISKLVPFTTLFSDCIKC